MSEADVSLIRDEDVLRRMWQQTEDFSRKKEIRAHMYRLREERLRNLYSPEPPAEGKDLKELSNAGWNVESENSTSEDGSTRVRSVRADVQGRYDVPGGAGQFAAVDQQRRAHTQHRDDTSSFMRDETSSSTAARDHVVRNTDDGSLVSSTTSSSSTSKFQQVSSTNELPCVTGDYDQSHDTNRTRRVTTDDYEQSLRRNEVEQGELVSRKVDYPDSNTKVIVETRTLPDGTRLTSTRREFRAPAHTETSTRTSDVKSSRITREFDTRTRDIVDSQRHADDYDFKRNITDISNQQNDFSQTHQINTSETKHFDDRQSSSKVVRDSIDNRNDTIDSHKIVDDYDLKNNIKIDYSTKRDYSNSTQHTERHESNVNKIDRRVITNTNEKKEQAANQVIRKDNYSTHLTRTENKTNETDHNEVIAPKYKNDSQILQQDVKETQHIRDDQERIHNITKDTKFDEIIEKKTSNEQFQTTYQTDYSQKKISTEWSPSHQAWASTLRADTPSTTRPTTRASSPGSKTYQSSTSSLRSSVSPDKNYKKPPSRGGSPSKVDRASPSRSSTDQYSSNHSTYSVTETKTNRYTSPDRKPPSAPRTSSSPDRKPDGYRQRPSISPDKRVQDSKPSTSPERKFTHKPSSSEDYPGTKSPSRSTDVASRPSLSPERKPDYPRNDNKSTPDSNYPRTKNSYRSVSPSKKTPEVYPMDSSPTRKSLSPVRKLEYQDPKQTSESPRSTSPYKEPHPRETFRPSLSPDRKPGHQQPSPTRASPEKLAGKYPKESSPSRPSTSPDGRPGYMRSTAASQPYPDTEINISPDRKSPFKHLPSQSPERKTYNKITNVKEDHYKLIDAETKMYNRTDRKNIDMSKKTSPSPERLSGPGRRSPSPLKETPVDMPDYCRSESPTMRPTLRKDLRSPSPPKGPVTFTQDQVDKTENLTSIVTDVKTEYDFTRDKQHHTYPKLDSKVKNSPSELEPNKYGTYDKKHTKETEQITKTLTEGIEDIKYDSLKRYEKTIKKITDSPVSPTKNSPRDNVCPAKPTETPRELSPTKFGTYDKKRRTEESEQVTSITKDTKDVKYDSSSTRRERTSPKKNPDLPVSPTKKSLRDNVSPVKTPGKDAKSKLTTEFISTEKTSEEVNKNVVTKDRPRQLVTPSTSPTRKPKTVETAPSTGQSSPTTSVSGFVYFGSPRNEKPIVTDLDDQEFLTELVTKEIDTTIQRPETLDVKRSPSPSKIPCRSPSPEKQTIPSKDSLPRKSSLKKPSTDFSQVSPTEKPPSNFRVSPTGDGIDSSDHKVVKKDNPDKPTDSPVKPKPPFERRETYEDRCRKILGMMHDDTKKTVTKETFSREPQSNLSSPSVSPCYTPEPKEQSPTRSYGGKDTTRVHVTDFITREQEDNVKKTTIHHENIVTTDRKTTIPSRESSPAKLQDIISQKTTTKTDATTNKASDTKKIPRTIQSPEIEIGYQKPCFKENVPRISPNRSGTSPERKYPENQPKAITPVRLSQSPDRKTGYHQPKDQPIPISEFHRGTSPSKYTETKDVTQKQVPDRRPSPTRSSPEKSPEDKCPKETTPTRSSVSPNGKPSYMKSTAATTLRSEETIASETISKRVRQSLDRETGYQEPKEGYSHEYSSIDSSKPKDKTPTRSSPDRKRGHQKPISSNKTSPEKELAGITPTKPFNSPDCKPGYMKSTLTSSTKYSENNEDVQSTEYSSSFSSKDSHQPSVRSDSPSKISEEPKHSRSSSPAKKVTTVTENTTKFIQSEREQEVLDRVQQSLRKLSPNRDQRSPSREKSPGKTTISLQDIDVTTVDIKDDIKITDLLCTGKSSDDKPKEKSKPTSRNVSPVKKSTVSTPTKSEKSPESPTKSRSISPRKPVSPTERPQSPQVSRPSGIKPREPIPSSIRKPTPGNTSPTKTEKITSESKKTTGVIKQNSFTKTSTTKTTTSKMSSPTNKPDPEPKKGPTPKGNKENVSPKKEDTKVTRTTSDVNLKAKKPSPQRIKSKPEIQVNDVSTTRTIKTTTVTTKKSTIKEPQTKLAPKPKSATALNTSTDEDDIIIDVEQAKSSRENSPDRICPTPVSFLEDVGTPRFPDEVSEPDDEFRRRTYHTIHETESLVDDIVEICEDDELFVKRTDVDRINESDECLLSVTDKVSKFTNKIETATKPKDISSQFKNTERKVHSDVINENLKSDECLLSVSEKVNKFAKGPKDTRDSRSPSRRIVDEYDNETIYTDDYTKLSVNDKAHLFVETAENVKATKTKPAQKVERPDLSNVDESLRSDDCLLSVSDKVNKFVKTAEQFLTESQESEERERKVKEQYEKIMKHIVQDDDDDVDSYVTKTKIGRDDIDIVEKKSPEDRKPSFTKETASSHSKVRDYSSPNLKPTEKTPIVKITTQRSSEAVKKAKAMFENIASTTQKTKDITVTKLTDIGVIKKSPKTDSTIVLHPSVEDGSPNVTDVDSEVDTPLTPTTKDRPSSGTLLRPHQPGRYDEKPRSSPSRLTPLSPDISRNKSPIRQSFETTTTKTVLSRYPAAKTEPPRHSRPQPDIHDIQYQPCEPNQPSVLETDKSYEKVPSYQRPTKTSQMKEETKTVEEIEVSSRRGSGKFGVELRRTSVERSTLSSERRRSTEHHQPCIEDIFDLDLLEQMLEKVVGYEQRRRIRAQIRVAKKKSESHTDVNTYTKTTKQTTVTKTKSPERRPQTKSPERHHKSSPQKTLSPERPPKSTLQKIPSEHTQPRETSQPLLNGHGKEPSSLNDKHHRPQSLEKSKPVPKSKSPVRQTSPDKKTRTTSPTKTPMKPKTNRFNEYASAYMKKVGLKENEKLKLSDVKTKKTVVDDSKHEKIKSEANEYENYQTSSQIEHKTFETKTSSISKSVTERTSSKDLIEIVHLNGKRSPSPDKKRTPERHAHSPAEHLHQRTPSPDFKRRQINNKETIVNTEYKTEPRIMKNETVIKTLYEERPKTQSKKETIIKTVYEIEKNQPKVQEEKPSWVTNRNLKKTSSEARTFSNKKLEAEKPRYRAPSPSKAISKPLDVITSSYGPGPLDADGRPLFGIKALRNGASNYQVKGTVIRQEYHSRNGSEPTGSVSVTAYSTSPEELERLLAEQGAPPSRVHGLAAITTTRRFGPATGATLRDAHSKEEHSALEQFTNSHGKAQLETLSGARSEPRTHNTCTTTVTEIQSDTTPDVRSTTTVTEVSSEMRGDEVKGVLEQRRKVEERGERGERKTVRQSSVKSLTEKYIKNASSPGARAGRSYPRAGLILRAGAGAGAAPHAQRADSAHAGLARADSEHSLGSAEEAEVVTTTTRKLSDGQRTTTTTTSSTSSRQERSFLDSSTKVTGVQDILTRMKNADIVIQEGDTSEDAEARALLNKFLGATVLMAGMQSYVADAQPHTVTLKQETVRSGGRSSSGSRAVEHLDLDQCWDERELRSLLEECTDYEQRRRLRARIRNLMAEQEACASAVTEALAAAGSTPTTPEADAREEAEVTVTSSMRRNSSEKTVSSSTTTKSSKVIESMTRPAPKPVSPFAKFRQLEKQNSTNSPNSPSAQSPRGPQSPGSPAAAQPYFKFTDPALQASALTIKERLLQWCRDKTRDYENVKLENFSTSWADGLAFCALLHHFLPDAFDYTKLTPEKRRHNFTLAFKIADEKAGIYPLLDVDDMVAMRKPDWKCVFTYVQSIHRRFKDQQ